MTEIEIQFSNMEEILQFCSICKKMDANIDVKNGKKWIDGKSLLGLMSLDMGDRLKLVVHGEDEESVDRYFGSFLRKNQS